MVVTVTVNPALDKTLIIKNFGIDKVNRVEEMHIDAGGKGINVSRVLGKLGIDTTAVSILGGNTGQLIQKLLRESGVNCEAIPTNKETRTNIKIVDDLNATCTDINENGEEISEKDLSELKRKVVNLGIDSEYVVLAGSVQDGIRKTIYKELIEELKKSNVKVALDTSGILLREGIKSIPWLIKPNVEELEELVQKKLETTIEIIDECKKLVELGIENVVITLGADGMLYFSKDVIIKVNVPKIKAMSTVGAGDSVVASIISGFVKKLEIDEILRNAAAMGTATVTLASTGVPNEETIEKYKKLITIEYL